MAATYDKYSAIAGTSVYNDGSICARDVNIELPEIEPITAELKAGGNMELPISGLIEAMEATITKVGVNIDFAKLVTFEHHDIEIRAAQDVLRLNGKKEVTPIRAILGCVAKSIPAINLEVESIPECEITFAVMSYKLYENNQELIYIDQPNGICRIDGKDYSSSINSLL